jgi:hypothetical protein
MTTTRGDAEFQRLVRVWTDLQYSRREAEREAREDQRVATVWRTQGMTQANVNRALAKLRGERDLFVADKHGRLRPAKPGLSIFGKRKNRTKKGGG